MGLNDTFDFDTRRVPLECVYIAINQDNDPGFVTL